MTNMKSLTLIGVSCLLCCFACNQHISRKKLIGAWVKDMTKSKPMTNDGIVRDDITDTLVFREDGVFILAQQNGIVEKKTWELSSDTVFFSRKPNNREGIHIKQLYRKSMIVFADRNVKYVYLRKVERKNGH